jgi:hypothetical protein
MDALAAICFGGKHGPYDFSCTVRPCYAEGTREMLGDFNNNNNNNNIC